MTLHDLGIISRLQQCTESNKKFTEKLLLVYRDSWHSVHEETYRSEEKSALKLLK